jgi:hypothetical protein
MRTERYSPSRRGNLGAEGYSGCSRQVFTTSTHREQRKLLRYRHREFSTFAYAVWPALHHGFVAGIEAYRFFTIRMLITK